MTKSTMEGSSQTCLVPQPSLSDGIPQLSLRLTDGGSCWKEMDLTDEISFINSDAFCSRLVLLFLSVSLFVLYLHLQLWAFWTLFFPLMLTSSLCWAVRQINVHIPVESTCSKRFLTKPAVCFSLPFQYTFSSKWRWPAWWRSAEWTGLRSDTRNYTDHKVQPKCKVSPLQK